VEVQLDPTRSPREQVDRLFHEARRLANAREMVRGRLEATARRAAELEAALAALEDAQSEIERARALEVARALGMKAQARRPEQSRDRTPVRLPYRAFAAADGTAILVGRSAKDNDSLTFRVARADDWWLHARGRTGTHVIVRTPRGVEPGQEALADAAQLAALYSEGGANDSGVEVAATPRKYVRKPKGAAPGSVTFSRARTLFVTPDPARLERLKSTRSEPTT
jgi:predicted ribosome quality control (RQC) complex YloA/Tae2 family protein